MAVIDELKKITNDELLMTNGVFYIGEKGGPEEKIAEARGIIFYGIHTGKLRRYFDWRNFVDVLKVPIGFFESLRILKKLNPDLVFAKGGYVSVPVVLAARFLRIPVWLHESDVSPGLANKICSRFAQKIWLSFEESRKFFKNQNAEVVGNPIRREILKGDKAHGYKLTGFSQKHPIILIMGGSTGAKSLNKLVEAILPQLTKKAQIIHVTGTHELSECASSYRPRRAQPLLSKYRFASTHYKTFEFLNEELAHIYSIADLIVSRAGSGGIFEALAWHKPMILIPLPKTASRGDQIENAAVFEKHGWAMALDQNTLTPSKFLNSIQAFLQNEHLQAAMTERQKKAKFMHAASRIAEAIRKFRQKP